MAAGFAEPDLEPVFMDRTGRRRRLARWLGAWLAGLLTLGLAALVAALFGAAPLTLPGLPQGGAATDTGRAAVPQLPAPSPAASPTTRGEAPATGAPTASPPAAGSAPAAIPAPNTSASPSPSDRRRGPPTERPHPGKSK